LQGEPKPRGRVLNGHKARDQPWSVRTRPGLGASCLVRPWCLVRGAESRPLHPHVTPPPVTRPCGPAVW